MDDPRKERNGVRILSPKILERARKAPKIQGIFWENVVFQAS